LLARVSDRGVELKCKRCKRVVLIPWGAIGSGTMRGPPPAM
jgi:hypothetical protein